MFFFSSVTSAIGIHIIKCAIIPLTAVIVYLTWDTLKDLAAKYFWKMLLFQLAKAPALSVAVKMRLHVEDFFLIADQPWCQNQRYCTSFIDIHYICLPHTCSFYQILAILTQYEFESFNAVSISSMYLYMLSIYRICWNCLSHIRGKI